MTHVISTIEELEALYGTPGKASIIKVANRMTEEYRRWIMTSRFCILSTVGDEGTDASPRGDDGPVVQELDEGTLLLPDWRGNNRLDSLRNIVRDGRISLMFLVPGSNNVVRLNGTAVLTTDPDYLARFEDKGRTPKTVIRVSIGEIYTQCARALIRSCLWTSKDESGDLPTVGEILAAQEQGFDGKTYDAEWSDRASKTMW